jgi:dihydrofolate reductase
LAKVLVCMSMSLDGFVAGPNISIEHPMGVGGERLHEWLADHPDRSDREMGAQMYSTFMGAVIMGRRTFTVGERPWGENGTFRAPCFVVTHRPAETLVKGETTFRFVTEGIERALEYARVSAGKKNINLMGAETAQQFLRAGLVDELHISLVPVLLGAGARLFEQVPAHVELERTGLVQSPTVTHLRFRVISELARGSRRRDAVPRRNRSREADNAADDRGGPRIHRADIGESRHPSVSAGDPQTTEDAVQSYHAESGAGLAGLTLTDITGRSWGWIPKPSRRELSRTGGLS